MEYSVRLTSYSIFQIQETISYISKVLLVPETAIAWSDYLEQQIAGLNIMPEDFRWLILSRGAQTEYAECL